MHFPVSSLTSPFAFLFSSLLYARANSSCVYGYSPCNKAGLPADFCCQSDLNCLAFNDNKSVICCPKDDECSKISPVSCNIDEQNVANNPSGQVHTTDLTDDLATCEAGCCPKSFTCLNNFCIMDRNVLNSSASNPTARAPSTTSKPITMSTITKSISNGITNTPSASVISGAVSTGTSTRFTAHFAPALGAGLGVPCGIILFASLVFLYRKRRTNKPTGDPQGHDEDDNATRFEHDGIEKIELVGKMLYVVCLVFAEVSLYVALYCFVEALLCVFASVTFPALFRP